MRILNEALANRAFPLNVDWMIQLIRKNRKLSSRKLPNRKRLNIGKPMKSPKSPSGSINSRKKLTSYSTKRNNKNRKRPISLIGFASSDLAIFKKFLSLVRMLMSL